MVMAKELLVSKHAGINVPIVKKVRKDSSEKHERTSQCLDWHYTVFPLFLTLIPFFLLLDSLVHKNNEEINWQEDLLCG